MFKALFYLTLFGVSLPLSAQVYLPNNNQWTGASVYDGSVLILAYNNGNARTFTPEQVTLFQLTSGWLSGAAQSIGVMETLDRSPRGARCLMSFEKLTLVDIARKYTVYWERHPAEHAKASLVILMNAMYDGHPCQ